MPGAARLDAVRAPTVLVVVTQQKLVQRLACTVFSPVSTMSFSDSRAQRGAQLT